MVKFASWVLFGAAFAVSASLAVMLLSTAADFGFGQVIAAGPLVIVMVAVLAVEPAHSGTSRLLEENAEVALRSCRGLTVHGVRLLARGLHNGRLSKIRFPPIAEISGLGPLSTHCRH